MKHLLFVTCILIFTIVPYASAQQIREDVVYLKDGSIVRGIIIEQIPDESLKIQIQGGSVMVLKMADVLKITKEMKMIEPLHETRKNPTAAFALSFFVPGGGQLYNNQDTAAVVHFGIAVVSAMVILTQIENGQAKYTNSELYVSLSADAYLINWVWSMVAAPLSAFSINKRIEENQASALMDDRLRLDPYLARNTRGLLLSLRF